MAAPPGGSPLRGAAGSPAKAQPHGSSSGKPRKKSAASSAGGSAVATWAAAAVVALLALGVGLFLVQQQQQPKPKGAPAAATLPPQQQQQQDSSSSATAAAGDGSSGKKAPKCDPDDQACLDRAVKAKKRRQRQGGVSDEEAAARRQRAAERVQADLQNEREQVVGTQTFHPSFGIFPKGCKWRTITDSSTSDVGYEFWQPDKGGWVPELPAACSPTGFNASEAPAGWDFYGGTPRSEVRSCKCAPILSLGRGGAGDRLLPPPTAAGASGAPRPTPNVAGVVRQRRVHVPQLLLQQRPVVRAGGRRRDHPHVALQPQPGGGAAALPGRAQVAQLGALLSPGGAQPCVWGAAKATRGWGRRGGAPGLRGGGQRRGALWGYCAQCGSCRLPPGRHVTAGLAVRGAHVTHSVRPPVRGVPLRRRSSGASSPATRSCLTLSSTRTPRPSGTGEGVPLVMQRSRRSSLASRPSGRKPRSFLRACGGGGGVARSGARSLTALL